MSKRDLHIWQARAFQDIDDNTDEMEKEQDDDAEENINSYLNINWKTMEKFK